MDAWRDIRLKARECHLKALAVANGDRRGTALIKGALQAFDLELHYYAPGTEVGEGVHGYLQRADGIVNVESGQSPADETVIVAHEIGHFNLHYDPSNEVTNVQTHLGGDPVDSGASRVEGYSPRERKEVQADIFAGEFLCPSDWLRDQIVPKGRRPSEIAVELGLPPNLVLHQAIRALLLPPLREPDVELQGSPVGLDDSQREAATWSEGPLLVDAGPGTGKTRTLIHRIDHILADGGSSGSILALTFSNKAAEEMRERLSVSNRDAAVEMWVGTFHAFGMELIQKWPGRVGREADVDIFDQTASLALLEAHLAKLPLRHFQNFFDPALELVHVLHAISRCKDELIEPDAYLAEAEAALASAPDDSREAAERAVEVGKVYAIYQQALADANAVDFGDLVMLAVRLLRENEDVRQEYCQRFKHILVDEYQDVNQASTTLLKLLAGGSDSVWVVADQRQSIYRFRGAAPANVANFTAEFGGKRLSLGTNYRSGGPVVRAFGEFSRHMASDPDAVASWASHRGELGEVSLIVAPDVTSEAAAIRDQIEELRAQGIPYRAQAILARSHLTLARITEVLEQLEVPLLYLGDLFERDEIRDLLSLVAIDAEFGGVGLVRVARLPEYAATEGDVLATLAWAQAKDLTVLQALARVGEINGLTDEGRAGLALLGDQLAGMGPSTSPWTLLTTWLFERSNYLKPLLASADPKAQQKLIAIYQLLKVCGEHLALNDTSRKRLLERIRRIEALNQDQPFRAVSSEASDFDAVRVLTLHSSKGLEFPAVHLPAIATKYMPASPQWNRCPPPPSLAHLAVQKSAHDAEEECLFFVGMSRARDRLCLSRAERYTAKVNASASKFLSTIQGHVSTRRVSQVALSAVAPSWDAPSVQDIYDERALDTYMRCPARYRYEVLYGLAGARDSSAYLLFHRCVHRTMAWLEQRARAGDPATEVEATDELARQWETRGPRGHGFESYYRGEAETMVRSIAGLIRTETGEYDREEWLVEHGGKRITLTPDRVILETSGVVRVQRVRTGRKSKSEGDSPLYALIRLGARQRYPNRPLAIETFYPSLGEAVAVHANDDSKLLKKYADAIAAIERGELGPAPKDKRFCPGCQSYFICGV